MKEPTIEEIIEYHREMILFDSGSFRAGVISDMLTRKDKNIIRCLYHIFRTLYSNMRTRYFYYRLPRDPEYWITLEDIDYTEYEEWIKDNKIKCHIFWHGSTNVNLSYSYAFKHKEDAMAFKLRWL